MCSEEIILLYYHFTAYIKSHNHVISNSHHLLLNKWAHFLFSTYPYTNTLIVPLFYFIIMIDEYVVLLLDYFDFE